MDFTATHSDNIKEVVQDFNQELQNLKTDIKKLVQESPDSDLMPRARAKANDYGLSAEIRDADLRTFILEARGARIGIAQPRLQGEVIDTTPVRWVWEGVMMAGSLNLLIAPPKIGKSALMIGMIAAWARGDATYLGQPLHGDCPNVYIVGTDQPESDWFTLLQREGLVAADKTLADPIKMLWSAGSPLHLTAEGIEHLRMVSETDPGSLFLIDSYHACISPLDIDEASSALDRPVRALMEAIAPSKATVALIHHANKSVSGGNATSASRGSNALPAAASLTILMNWLKQPTEGQTQNDYRVILKTQGRARGCSLVTELQDTGWMLHGEGDDALRAEAFADAEAELSGRQADVFDFIADRWETMQMPVAINEVAGHFSMDRNKANRAVRQLERKGLLTQAGTTETTNGRPSLLFAPLLPPSRRVVQTQQTEQTPRAHHEIRGLYPFSPLSHMLGGGLPGATNPLCHTPPLEPNASVELLQPDGSWANGWKLHKDSTAHAVTVWRLDPGGRLVKRSGMRWEMDVRLSSHEQQQPSHAPAADPGFNPDDQFPF